MTTPLPPAYRLARMFEELNPPSKIGARRKALEGTALSTPVLAPHKDDD